MPQELLILSPEKTVVSLNLARVGSRIYAQILDLLLFGAAFLCIAMGLMYLFSNYIQVVGGVVSTLGVLGFFAYFILFEGFWNGQTIGKRALNIRVRSADGTPITFSGAVARNLLRVADVLPTCYFVGFVAMFTNKRSQRIGDMVGGTIVTQESRSPRFSPAPYILGVHPFESHVGDLFGMTADEYAALKRMCDRFPELSGDVQERLIEELWVPFAQKLKIQPLPNVHPVYLAEAVVMKYGRRHGLL